MARKKTVSMKYNRNGRPPTPPPAPPPRPPAPKPTPKPTPKPKGTVSSKDVVGEQRAMTQGFGPWSAGEVPQGDPMGSDWGPPTGGDHGDWGNILPEYRHLPPQMAAYLSMKKGGKIGDKKKKKKRLKAKVAPKYTKVSTRGNQTTKVKKENGKTTTTKTYSGTVRGTGRSVISPTTTEDGVYTTKKRIEVHTPEGPRWYEGKGTSRRRDIARMKANLRAQSKSVSSPADSVVAGGKIPEFKTEEPKKKKKKKFKFKFKK